MKLDYEQLYYILVEFPIFLLHDIIMNIIKTIDDIILYLTHIFSTAA